MIEPLRSRLQNWSLLKLTWLAGHLSLIIGAIMISQIGRPQFAGYFSYIVFAILIIDLLYIFKNTSAHSRIPTRPGWVTNRKILIILYLLSITILFTGGRGLLFHLVTATTAFAIILQIILITEKKATSRRIFYLITIMMIFSTLILSQVLSVSYYANISDSIWHTSFIHVVAEYGSINSIEIKRYRFLPAFHVLGAISVQVTRLTPRTTAAIIMVVSYQMVTLLVYLVANHYTRSERIGLLSAALFGTNASVLFRASEAHSQELSFGFFCIIFFLFIKNRDDLRFLLIFTCIALTWIVTHHLSVGMGLVMLGLVVANRLYQSSILDGVNWYNTTVHEWIALSGVVITYWVFTTSLLQDVIAWIFGYSPRATGEQSNLLIQTYDNPYTLLQETIPYSLNYSYYAFLLAFMCIGFYMVFITEEHSINGKNSVLLVLGGAGLFYFPNPFWIPIEGIAVPLRWATIAFFIIVPITSIGLIGVTNKISSWPHLVSVIVIIFLLVFTNISIGLADPTLINHVGYDTEPKKYISENELSAVDFVQSHQMDDQTIWAPSFLPTYIDYYPPDPEVFHEDETQKMRMSASNREIMSGDGLTIVTENTYRTNSIQVVAVDDTCDNLGLATASESNSQWNYESGEVIYSNGRTSIQSSPATNLEEFHEDCAFTE